MDVTIDNNLSFGDWDNYTFDNRNKLAASLPHKIVFRIIYDKSESMRKQVHLYHILPMMEVNTGEINVQPLNDSHRILYTNTVNEYKKVFGKVDFTKFYTVEELSNAFPAFADAIEERFNRMRKGFPDDITFDEEGLLYAVNVNVSKNQVAKFFNIDLNAAMAEPLSEKDKEIADLKSQVSQLTDLVKQLIENK